MSGHWPTLLRVTESSAPRKVAVQSVLELLEDEYLAQLARLRSGDPATIAHDGSTIILGEQEVWMEIDFATAPGGGDNVCVAIQLDSKAYEAAYDLRKRRAKRRALEALVKFCVAVSAAIGSEGFLLQFDKGSEGPLMMDTFVGRLTGVNADAGLICGIAASSGHWPEVEPYWPGWLNIDGYQVKSFLG